MIKKIALMHKLFGMEEGKCGECSHLIIGDYNSLRNLKKCEIYGMTHSSATDWAKSYRACGLKNKDTNHCDVINLVKIKHPLTQTAGLWDETAEDPLPGQISLDELLEEEETT